MKRNPASRLAAPTLALALVVGVACGDSAVEEHVLEGETMGTYFRVKVIAEPLSATEERDLATTVRSVLDNVNERMSTYDASSELSRFNSIRSTDPVALSQETVQVLLIAGRVHRASRGAFDPTVGPLVDMWGFGPGSRSDLPTEADIAAMMAHTGFDKIEFLDIVGAVRKLDPEVGCDLSAVAKGFAVDLATEAIAGLGYASALVEVGGEVRAMGTNREGLPWRVAVESPRGEALQQVVPLAELSMATSGDYRNFFESGGVRYSHTIDPRTGWPVSHSLASASVVDRTCARADAWATAMMVLGPDEGWDLAVERDLAVLFVEYLPDGDLGERMTPAFEALLEDPLS